MLLRAFLQTVYLPSRVEVTAAYAGLLASTVAQFALYLHRQAKLTDLTEANVGGFLAEYKRLRSAVTTNNARRMLLTLWRAAFDHGLLAAAPRTRLIRRLPEAVDPPEAWTVAEVERLLVAASQVNGAIVDVPAGLWWASLLQTIYWTACRIGSLLATPSNAYDGAGVLVRQQKNHRPQWYSLPPCCQAAIDATWPMNRKLLWPWPHHRNTLYVEARRIVDTARLPCPHTGRQLFHRLRRTTLSLCAAVDPAIAQRQAGHTDYATTLKHYIDPRIVHADSAADVLPVPLPTRRTLSIYG
jgi:integrase